MVRILWPFPMTKSTRKRKMVGTNVNCLVCIVRLLTIGSAPKPKRAKVDDETKKDPTPIRADWVQGQDMPYLVLARVFAQIEDVTSRKAIQKYLTDLFTNIIQYSPNDLLPCIYLCVCTQLAPPFENVQIGIGDSLLMKAIGEATGTKQQHVKQQYQKEGDLGLVAKKSRSNQRTLGFVKPKPLYVAQVYKKFRDIAAVSGNRSQDRKVSVIKSLLVSSRENEAQYIIRGLQGKLRIGLAEKTILMSLADAVAQRDQCKPEKAVDLVKRAFCECPSYDALVPALLKHGVTDIKAHCHLQPGIPVSPMLARPTKCYSVVFDRFANRPFTCEYKYDGERAQIHITNRKTVKIFSRNFEDSTERFPDVISSVLKVH